MNVYLKFFFNDLKHVLNCTKNKRYLNHFFVLSSINSLKWFGNVLLKKNAENQSISLFSWILIYGRQKKEKDKDKEKESCPEKFKIYPGVILFCWKHVFRLPAF